MSNTLHIRLALLLTILILSLGIVHAAERPNILFCISDDQSYAHAGVNGDPLIQTPAFDRVAREGIRFTRAFCDAPSCGPSRSAILTGQPIWRLEEAGNIHSTLPKKFETYTDVLKENGYTVGYTGKGWSPGRDAPGGREENAAGRAYSRFQYARGELKDTPQPKGMSSKAYAANFKDFLSQRPQDKPFCFWLGTHEPHRGYQPNLWKGKDLSKVVVPASLPDHETVRRDLLDYSHEIEYFDRVVGEALALLEKRGQLDNTIVVVTSDHGMPFPRAKASLYDAGTHVPLAIRWPEGISTAGRVHEGLVSLSDLAPTFLEAVGLRRPEMMIASSLLEIFSKPSAERRGVYIAMERHDGCRKGGKGYPSRALRTGQYLYIKNFEPDRWPAGNPDREFCARYIPFGEVDSSPTKSLLMENKDKEGFRRFYDLAFAKRPAEELYDVRVDPGQLVNLAGKSEFARVQKQLRAQLQERLVLTKDPRVLGLDAPWDYYPYYGSRRNKNWQVEKRP